MRLLTALLFTLLTTTSFSEVIDWNNFDNKLFNKKVIERISSIRGGDSMVYDHTCFQAAEMHGLYLVNNKMSVKEFSSKVNGSHGGHLEPLSPNTNTSDQRISYFRKSSDKSAEVCAMDRLKSNETYESLANRMIGRYMSSGPHKIIIIDKRLKYIGASMHVTEDKTIYSVIVFTLTSHEDSVKLTGREEAIYDSVFTVQYNKYKEKLNKGWCDEIPEEEIMKNFLDVYESKIWVHKELGLPTDTILDTDYNTYLICSLVEKVKKNNKLEESLKSIFESIETDLNKRKSVYNAQKKPL